MQYKAISADSHVNEPPDLFQKHLPSDLVDRGPHCIDLENGGQGWVMEDLDTPIALGMTAVNFRAQRRFDRASFKDRFMEYRDGDQRGVRYEDILPGSFDPSARINEQDEANVDAEVLFSTPALWRGIKSIKDKKLQLACFRAYNDWIGGFDEYDSARLAGVGLIPATGVDDAIAELRRCVVDLGLRAVALESYPNGSLTEPDASDDRFWRVAEELGVPICLHASFTVPVNANALFASGPGAWRAAVDAGRFSTVLEKLILSGLFDRFPKIRFVGVEVQSAWVPFFFEQFDDRYRRYNHLSPVKLELLPSDYLNRNVLVTFIIDPIGVANRHRIGIGNMMWSTDFPHSVSNWPIDVELATAQLDQADVPEFERERLMWRTCADLYGFAYDA